MECRNRCSWITLDVMNVCHQPVFLCLALTQSCIVIIHFEIAVSLSEWSKWCVRERVDLTVLQSLFLFYSFQDGKTSVCSIVPTVLHLRCFATDDDELCPRQSLVTQGINTMKWNRSLSLSISLELKHKHKHSIVCCVFAIAIPTITIYLYIPYQE